MSQRDGWREHQSVRRIRDLSVVLGDLNNQIVYIGGAIAPILQIDPPFAYARATNDVDAISTAASYTKHARIQSQLRKLRFREDANGAHAHRWHSPSGIRFDLVPAGQHLGASGQKWDAFAIERAETTDIGDGISIRHASAPAFLALKLAAFHDRGATDPAMSHDLEDIIALLVSRPRIIEEVSAEQSSLRKYVARGMKTICSNADFEDLLAGTLATAFDRAHAFAMAKERVTVLSVLK